MKIGYILENAFSMIWCSSSFTSIFVFTENCGPTNSVGLIYIVRATFLNYSSFPLHNRTLFCVDVSHKIPLRYCKVCDVMRNNGKDFLVLIIYNYILGTCGIIAIKPDEQWFIWHALLSEITNHKQSVICLILQRVTNFSVGWFVSPRIQKIIFTQR